VLEHRRILLLYVPYILVGLGFLIFLKINGSVALGTSPTFMTKLLLLLNLLKGDKANHVVVFHFPQILYFLGFTGYFFVPLFTPHDFDILTGWLKSTFTR
jgi:hypothetical protein